MPTFLHPALLWGLLIAGVPVLIHLINLFRHRRVPWAAMEFLLISQRRNRTWVLLKQLLLLLLRMTAVAVLVLMLTHPRLPTQWGRFLDGQPVHHIVLLDDSFSMTEQQGGSQAWDRAKAAVERIARDASHSSRPQTFSLIRFSQAANENSGKPDLLDESVRGDFLDRLSDHLKELDCSETSAGPLPALEGIERWLGADSSDQRIVYLLTDFRTNPWAEPGDLKPLLQGLSRSQTGLHLVPCVDRFQPNVAVASLRPDEGIRAAGVPFFLDVAVTNHGDAPLNEVVVQVQADGQARPALRIPRLPPRQTVADRIPMQFALAGTHVVQVELDSDAVALDNHRYCVVDVPAELPVLLIDGNMEAEDATYLSSALRPGGAVVTGLTPRIEKPRFLSQNTLGSFSAIYLLNVERLEDSAIKALEQYVAAGGGLCVFLGPRCAASFFNEKLYRGGTGLFPVPLTGQEALLVDRLEKTPDMQVTDHPIFRVFSGQRNGFLGTVSISRYFATVDPLPESAHTSVEVLARLRNGAPLVVERQFGKGRVVAFLTTAGPEWNNWTRGNPSFVVTMLELQAYLSRPAVEKKPALVGDDLTVSYDASLYQPQVRWVPPVTKAIDPSATEATLQDNGTYNAILQAAPVSGVYRAEYSAKDGGHGDQPLAVNIDPEEGKLDLVDGPALAAALEGVDYRYEPVSTFRYAEEELEGRDLTDVLLYALIALLVLEQLVAYWVGDHPPRTVEKGGDA